ncbi:glycosyltransferase family 4 protein [Cobetia marina]|uniref:glycosyltransferase n=1 Tax=Cobetia marina TaxID=28258 RepID=UPI0010AEA0E0|nr:glycosyltransferase [Cobetia marina]TKD62624.1 glycosyltransferase family 4 protein [Cobetia marina]
MKNIYLPEKNKLKIAFIQPCIPHYRVDFFGRIASEVSLHLFYGEEDNHGVKTSAEITNAVNYNHHGYIYFRKILFPRKFLTLLSKLRSMDCIILYGNVFNLSNYPIYVLSRLLGIKIVWFSQLLTSGTDIKKARLRLRIISIFSDAFLTYTEHEQELSKQLFTNTYSIGNGLNIDEIESAICGLPKEKISRPAGLSLIFIGRLTSKSQIMFLLEVINQTKISKLYVIGDGALLDSAEKYVQENNLSDIVIFLGKITDENLIAKFALISDAFIYPGDVGLSLMHAFSYGLPAIIHDDFKSHMPEASILIRGYNGFMYKRSSKESLIKTINKCQCMKENNLLIDVSINAKKTVSQNYNTKAMAQNFLNMLGNVI